MHGKLQNHWLPMSWDGVVPEYVCRPPTPGTAVPESPGSRRARLPGDSPIAWAETRCSLEDPKRSALGRETAEHARGERGACVLREERMARRECEAEEMVRRPRRSPCPARHAAPPQSSCLAEIQRAGRTYAPVPWQGPIPPRGPADRLAVAPQVDGDHGREQDHRHQHGDAQHAERRGYSPAILLRTEGGPGGPDDPRVDGQEPDRSRDRPYRGQVVEE